MKKLLFIPILSFGITTYPDFSMCYKKYKNYSIIPISKHYSITSIPQKNFIKKEFGIYLIKAKNKNYIHFKKSHLGVWIASITKNSIYSGNYAKYQTSLQNPAQISTKTEAGSIITDIFCNPIGIGVNNGFISKSFISKFIKSKPIFKTNALKFIGILYDKNFIITKILPNSIASSHYIQKGSKIIKINNQKIGKNIPNKINSVTILQQGIEFTIKVKNDKI